jgi:hypothetical protein
MSEKELAIGLRGWIRDHKTEEDAENVEALSGAIQELSEHIDWIRNAMDDGDKGAALMEFDNDLKRMCKMLCGEEDPRA